MPYKPVDTAIKIIVGPLIDDTDFKTREESIAYNQAGMEIDVIMEKSDGTVTTTAVTPTTGGDYDWAHTDQGYYEMEIPASGGADYNNDEEGVLTVVGYCTGVLPFRSVAYDVVPTMVYNSHVRGTDVLQVDVTQIDGLATNGNNATLNLKQLNVVNSAGSAIVATSSGSNGHGAILTGNGTGIGLKSVGGVSGSGGHFQSGASSGFGMEVEGESGTGLYCHSNAGNGSGISCTGNGTGWGIRAGGGASGIGFGVYGGTNGSGFVAQSGASSGFGMEIDGQSDTALYAHSDGGNGSGILITGNGSGDGISSTGGSTGYGAELTGGGSGYAGLRCVGDTAGAGALFAGGTTGPGIQATGGGTSGSGIVVSSTSGDGMTITAGGGNGDGLQIAGNGSGTGINIDAGATGIGIDIAGGGTSGDGIKVTTTSGHAMNLLATGAGKQGFRAVAQTTGAAGGAFIGATDGNGLSCTGVGTGTALYLNAGATGNGLWAEGGGTSGEGVKITTTSGDGVLIQSGGGNGDGVQIVGNGSGSGVNIDAGATGRGLTIDSTTGDVVVITSGGGNGNAMTLTANGTGSDFSPLDASISELSQAQPTSTPSVRTALMLPYMELRNKAETTSSQLSIYNDAGTLICKGAMSDDGTTFTKDKIATGP